MRFAILGAGALGSILGAHLARAGHSVTILARGERLRQIRERGLEIRGLAEFSARCDVIPDAAQLERVDVFVLAVKTYATEAALAGVRAANVATVFSVQNGVLKDDQLARIFSREKTLGAMADFSGELQKGGEVLFTRNVNLFFGSLSGGDSARAGEITGAIDAAGIHAKAVENIEAIEWSKFVGWAGLMAVAVLTRLETGKFLADPGSGLVFTRMVREVGSLAAALKIPIIDNSPVPVATICALAEKDALRVVQNLGREFLSKAPGHRMSSLQDADGGRRLEVEETLGFAVRKAAELNLRVPTLEICYSLVSAVDRAAQAATSPPAMK